MADEKTKPDPFMPVLVVRTGTMAREEILRVQGHAGICIIECDEPESMRFLEPPIKANIEDKARAALHLIRQIMTGTDMHLSFSRGNLARWYAHTLIEGLAVDPVKKVSP